MRNCLDFEVVYQRLASNARVELSDRFALHLDECTRCRARFDENKIQLEVDVLDLLRGDHVGRLPALLRRLRAVQRIDDQRERAG